MVPVGGAWIAAGAAVAVASGGARLGVVAAAVLLVLGLTIRTPWRDPLLWMGALTAIALFGVIHMTLPEARDDLIDRTETVIDELQNDDGIPEDVRVANIRASLNAWAAHPIVGTGPGRFGSTTAWATGSPLHDQFGLPDLRSEEFVAELRERGDLREIDVGVAQLDLGWFQVLSEIGAVGLVALIVLIGSVSVRAIRARNPVSVALLSVLCVVSLGGPGLVDLSLASVVLFWAGATVSSTTHEQKPDS
jgi:O-antigen ligase